MKELQPIEIHITELEKSDAGLTLFNFRDELVNFMYKKTVADSSRVSMRFYILVFFLATRVESKSLLLKLFDENFEKLKKLNEKFGKRAKLQKNEYAKLVREAGLTEIFRNDILFLLLTSILESEKVLEKYSEYFVKEDELRKEFSTVVNKYGSKLTEFSEDFVQHFIADDRTDDFGRSLDLSKSVFRTIQMRTSRQLDLTLHKYADLKSVKSESPIDLTILQHIDPRMVIDLWEIYNLGDYVKAVWGFAADFGVQSFLGFKGIQYITRKWLKWKNTDGRKQRKEKIKAKKEFEEALKDPKYTKQLAQLAAVLTESILKSNEFLQKEIEALEEQLQELAKTRSVISGKETDKKMDELKKRIEKLKNIKVKAVKKKPRKRSAKKGKK